MERLLDALEQISARHEKETERSSGDRASHLTGETGFYVPETEICNIPEETEMIPVGESAGRISASSVIPYPPGIHVICPGEVISRKTAEYVKRLCMSGHKITGTDRDMRIAVGIKKQDM